MIEYSLFQEVIEWAAYAGRQEALMAIHDKREVESRGGMGLWQSFQAKFPKDRFEADDYDLAINLYSTVYAASAKNCLKAIANVWDE